MNLSLILPGLIAVGLVGVVGLVRWELRPKAGAAMLGLAIAGALVTTTLVIVVVVVSFAAERSPAEALVGWCPVVADHREVSWFVGLAALGALAIVAIRVRRVLAARSWARSGTRGRRLRVLDTAEPIAYAAPGRPGCVVVSRGMLGHLDTTERRALFAHERAHLRHNHHRYLLLADLGVAVLPMLRPVADQVRLATERHADEVAACSLGGDRRAVARAIARAGLAKADYASPHPNFTGGSLAARIDALTGEPPSRATLLAASAAVTVVLVGTLSASTVQLHHLAEFIAHACGS